MKKFASLLIALLLSATAFASCQDTSGEQSEATNSTGTSNSSATSQDNSAEESDDPYTDERGIYVTTLDPNKYTDKEFTIIVRGEAAAVYQSDDFVVGSEYYGDTLQIAVETRNKKIEETYGTVLNVIKENDYYSKINLDLTSGTQLYDAIMPTLPQLAGFAQQGYLCDLTQLESMNIDAPWYDQNANAAFSIGGHLFFTTGDITILNKVNTPSMLFNKDYAEELQLPDLYQLVRDNEWTYDKMMEFAKKATFDSDGESGMTGADNWGVLNAHGDALSFYRSFGYTICAKDGNDYPYLCITEETNTTALQRILTDMAETGTWCCYAQDFDGDIWSTSLEAFKQGRVLFRPSAFSAATKLRIAGTNFGILPMPLMNSDQDHYWASCGTGETAGFGIPLNAKDPEFSAYMIEAYSCEAKNYLTPAYMEVNLKSKDAKDDADLEMIEIIFNNIRYDVGDVYNFGKIKTVISDMVKEGDANIVSKLDSITDSINEEIETIIDEYQSKFD